MSFRQEVRAKYLAIKARTAAEFRGAVHAPPSEEMADDVDMQIIRLASTHTKGAQFRSFMLRYWRDESDPEQRRVILAIYNSRNPSQTPEVAFEVIARNSLRAFERILDKAKEDQRRRRPEGREDAQDDT